MRAHASPDVSHLLLQSSVLPKRGFPVVFHGLKGSERRTRYSPSYFNILEASVVRDYCQKLTQDREHKICESLIVFDITADLSTPVVDEHDIGVIAPYKAQVRTIRELLKLAGLKDVSVGSVEQFQGQVRAMALFFEVGSTNSYFPLPRNER
jgi:helicase MOV-10